MHSIFSRIAQRLNLRSFLAAALLFGAVANLAGSVESRGRNMLTEDEARTLAMRAYLKSLKVPQANRVCKAATERQHDWLVTCDNPDAAEVSPTMASVSKKTRKVSLVANR